MGLFWWTLVEAEEYEENKFRLVREKWKTRETIDVVWDRTDSMPNLKCDGWFIADYGISDVKKCWNRNSKFWRRVETLPTAKLLQG